MHLFNIASSSLWDPSEFLRVQSPILAIFLTSTAASFIKLATAYINLSISLNYLILLPSLSISAL